MSVARHSDSVRGHRTVERVTRARWGARFLRSIFLVLAASVVAAHAARADDWVTWHDRGQHCSDGIECALQDYNYYVSITPQKPWVFDRCEFQNNNPNAPGQYVAVCHGGETQPGESAALDGIALLSCSGDARMGATGCIQRPPPDQRRACAAETANPVDVRSGTKREYKLEFSTADGLLKFERYYMSNQDSKLGNLRETRLGRGWRSNFNSRFNYLGSVSSLVIALPSGETLYFSQDGSGYAQQHYSWDADSLVAGARGQVATLKRDSATGNFTLTTSDGRRWVYDFHGQLQTITDLGGYSQTLTYDAN